MAKKSPNGTSRKKSITGSISAMTIPKVMAIESRRGRQQQAALMTASPGRGFGAQVDRDRGQARPGGRACTRVGVCSCQVTELLDQPEMPSRADCVSAYWSSFSGMNSAASAIAWRFSM